MRIKPARGRGCWKQMLASPLVAVLVHGRAFLVFLFKLLTDSFGSSALISLRTTSLLNIAAWTPCSIVHNSFWLGIAWRPWPRLQGVTNSPYTCNSGLRPMMDADFIPRAIRRGSSQRNPDSAFAAAFRPMNPFLGTTRNINLSDEHHFTIRHAIYKVPRLRVFTSRA